MGKNVCVFVPSKRQKEYVNKISLPGEVTLSSSEGLFLFVYLWIVFHILFEVAHSNEQFGNCSFARKFVASLQDLKCFSLS